MPADEPGETRTQYLPRTGSKISILLGLVLLVAAVYTAVVPLSVASQTGVQFGCGTALSPNMSSFGKGYCSAVDQEARYRAIALLIAALLVAGVGSTLFGFDKRSRTRIVRDDLADDYDDEHDDEHEDEDALASGPDDRRSKTARVRPGRGASAAPHRSARSRPGSNTDRPARSSAARGTPRDDARVDEDDLDDGDIDDRDYDHVERDDADGAQQRMSEDRPRNQRGPRNRR